MKNKKSQAEIVGLVIIVLLITIGLLFVVKFVVLREPSDIKEEFVHSELASNMINVLLKTTTDCRGSSVTDLFQDCAGFVERIDCNDDNVPDSCDKVDETIEMIFNNSLEKWNKPYEFKAVVGSKTIRERSYGKCQNTNRESKTYPIPTDRGTLSIKLDICG